MFKYRTRPLVSISTSQVLDTCYNLTFSVTITAASGATPTAMTWTGITTFYVLPGHGLSDMKQQRVYNYTAGCTTFHELVSLYQATKQNNQVIKLSPSTSVVLPDPPYFYRSVPTYTNVNKLSSIINSWTRATGWSNYENIQEWCSPAWYGLKCVNGVLTEINLENNNLVGNMTVWFATIGSTWTGLLKFALGNNKLSGVLPASFLASSTLLQTFTVHNNLITGALPGTLGSAWAASLQTFSLAQNQLSGTISEQFGLQWSTVKYIALNNNQLSGSISAALGVNTWSQLFALQLSFNLLSGTIPVGLGAGTPSWGALSQVFFNSNTALTGTLPASFGNRYTQIWFQNTSLTQHLVPSDIVQGVTRNTPGYQVTAAI